MHTMAENQQSEVFSKVLEDLEKFCDVNNKIKESVKIADVNREESVDEIYETLQYSLENSAKVLSDIVDFVRKSREQWLALKGNKQQQGLLNGCVETNEVQEGKEQASKVGAIKLVSLDKLLDPSRLNDAKDDAPVIVLSDAESDDKAPRKRSTVARKNNEKQLNTTRTAASKPRPLRTRTKRTYKIVEDDSSSSSSEEETRVKYNNRNKRSRRKGSDSSASDPEFVVAKKVKKPERKTGGKKMSESESDGRKEVVDKKFHWKAYVPLPRVQCEKLKEYYSKRTKIAQQRDKITLSSLLNDNSEEATELTLSDFVKKKVVGTEKAGKVEPPDITDHTRYSQSHQCVIS